MLIRFKKNYEKIAMGLLSLMPSEKDIKKLQQTIKKYEENEEWQLFLWKEEDIIGIIGIHLEDSVATLQHVCVNPSHRQEGIGKKMIAGLKSILGDDVIIQPSEHTATFYEKYEQSINK